ncbi:LytTR family DNA-binding domain-containing protein [Pontixanthobacter gangjinensis]|uniref:LytTR family transcriptional regulator n=1 Tax=Pontixanthobacter gangjinensis TaxID=1028742 RepID=A0A6I4SKT0_9SPHN|nr:LytTR family DNA-binding domain-containing protein [Pontixanthobacter gangjinensis]MXO55397.1 LytTR family transcriptional regulator [Pontixanthobacter gangjinensis]
MSKPRIPAEKHLARKILIDLSIMTVIGVILALIGPFGSFEEPLPYRLVNWMGFAYIGYAIYSPMGAIVDRIHAALELPNSGLWIAAVLAATVPMTIVVWSIGFLPKPVPLPSLEQALTSYFYVLVIGGGVTALFNALEAQKTRVAQAPSKQIQPAATLVSEPEETVAKFIDRLPPALGSDLIALEMEDHYVRAHTALGSELVLLRLRDAVAELGGLDGQQVHRSWWVARGAVADVKRERRNVRLVLDGGLEAPVSRANVAQLKELGWF